MYEYSAYLFSRQWGLVFLVQTNIVQKKGWKKLVSQNLSKKINVPSA